MILKGFLFIVVYLLWVNRLYWKGNKKLKWMNEVVVRWLIWSKVMFKKFFFEFNLNWRNICNEMFKL